MDGGACYTEAVMSGTVESLFLKPASGQPMQPVDHFQMVAGKGIDGDAAFGRNRRQVLIVDRTVLDQFGLKPGDLRENVTVSGLDLSNLQAGSLLSLGESVLLVQGECTPCSKVEELQPGLQEAISKQRGILASVHQGGPVTIGDKVSLTDS
jgi:MOSC domain-containing protein YiiM